MHIDSINMTTGEKKQLLAIMDLIKKEYSDNLIGLYLFGSSVQGGLKKNSDLDFLTITKASLSQDSRLNLTNALMNLSKEIGENSDNSRYIELTNVIQKDIVPLKYPISHDYLYGEWLREDFKEGMIPQKEANTDLTIVLYQAEKKNIDLLNNSFPLPLVPHQMVERAILDGLPELINDIDGDESNVILTLCRMLYTLQTGSIVSKSFAGECIKKELSKNNQKIINKAINEYLFGITNNYNKNEMISIVNELSRLIQGQ